MARTLPDKGIRRSAFLRCLAEGETVAAAAERVIFAVAGIPMVLKDGRAQR